MQVKTTKEIMQLWNAILSNQFTALIGGHFHSAGLMHHFIQLLHKNKSCVCIVAVLCST